MAMTSRWFQRKGSYLTWEGKEWRSWYHPSSIESGLRTVIIENTSAVKEYFALCKPSGSDYLIANDH